MALVARFLEGLRRKEDSRPGELKGPKCAVRERFAVPMVLPKLP